MDPCAQGSFLYSRWLQPLPARLLPGRASSGFQQVRGCSLNRQSEGKLGALTSFLKLLIFALLIHCSALTCYLCKRNRSCRVPRKASEHIPHCGRRCRSELQAAAFISARGLLSSLPGQQAVQGWGRRRKPGGQCLGRKVEAALLDLGVQLSWRLGGFTGSRCSSWWTGVFLVS